MSNSRNTTGKNQFKCIWSQNLVTSLYLDVLFDAQSWGSMIWNSCYHDPLSLSLSDEDFSALCCPNLCACHLQCTASSEKKVKFKQNSEAGWGGKSWGGSFSSFVMDFQEEEKKSEKIAADEAGRGSLLNVLAWKAGGWPWRLITLVEAAHFAQWELRATL